MAVLSDVSHNAPQWNRAIAAYSRNQFGRLFRGGGLIEQGDHLLGLAVAAGSGAYRFRASTAAA
jgi:hypothetical protein